RRRAGRVEPGGGRGARRARRGRAPRPGRPGARVRAGTQGALPDPGRDRPELMARRTRLDAELVRRGLARSREQAAELIAGGPVELVVADLSFISLRLVLPALADCLTPDGDLVPMVKPQFEVGRAGVGPGGVVRDPLLWASAIRAVAETARALGFGVAGLARS